MGAFVSTHGKSIDEVDRSIVEARTALNEVTQELQERALRWKQIEMLCGFNIINNNGFNYLENTLYRNFNSRGGGGLRGKFLNNELLVVLYHHILEIDLLVVIYHEQLIIVNNRLVLKHNRSISKLLIFWIIFCARSGNF